MLSIDDSREYLSALKGNTAMLRSIYPSIDADIRTLQKLCNEFEEIEATPQEEFDQRQRIRDTLKKYIIDGLFLSFKHLFENLRVGKWYCCKPNYNHWVDPWELMRTALEENNSDICIYLTEYVNPSQRKYMCQETIFHQAVYSGSYDALKSMCEAYQKHNPEIFKLCVKIRTQFPKQKQVSPYQLALSYIGKKNWSHKYSQFEEIAEYLKQFE